MANIISSALTWTLLIQGTYALPSLRRQDPSPMLDVQQLTQQAIQNYLNGANLKNGTTVHLEQPWRPIDFAGSNAGTVTGPQANKILFDTCDMVPAIESNGTTQSFSQIYTTFLQEINKVLPKNDGNNTELNAATENQAAVCKKPKAVLAQGVDDYLSAMPSLQELPNNNLSDPNYLQWAQAHYTPYIEANDACVGAQNNVSKIRDTIYGDNGALFAIASTIINVFDETTPGSQPGINMPIDDSATPQYKPEYYMPLLNNTVQTWQQLPGDAAPASSFSYNHDTTSNDSKTSSGGGGISFIWDDFSGSGEGGNSQTTSNTSQKAQAFSLTWGGITTMPIEYGIWFDDYRLAGAAQNPPPNDNVSALAKPVFDEYFGTAEKPGQVSRYNAQMIIGYKPTWSISFTDKEQYSQLKETSAKAEACFLFICASGNGASSSNHTTTDDTNNSITFQDTTNNAYILGFIMTSIWGPN
ncbi:hypothetical protein C8R43DRAFT_1114064 [Mycena crocata]|nr:hypothetical protein C8R43DRAFT_1114064 [Mycena crocata]